MVQSTRKTIRNINGEIVCLYPRLIRNRKYTPNKKNGGKVPEVKDPRVLYVPVGCGECIECRKQKAREWQVRLMEEIKTKNYGMFITLTLNDESISKLCELEEVKMRKGYDKDNAIATKATRLFLERWRKKYKKSLRHWLVTELGHNGTENIHMHGIVWWSEPLTELENIWQYGFVWKGQYVNTRTVNYIIKYITKKDEKHPLYKSKILTSPGIGGGYCDSMDSKRNHYNEKNPTETNETYKTSTGHKIAMPVYWRNKIYTESEREKLWLQRIDKNERWVCGEKIKANETETYFKILEWHRQRNRELGYGDGKRDEDWWDRKEYEKAQREILIETRRQKGEK